MRKLFLFFTFILLSICAPIPGSAKFYNPDDLEDLWPDTNDDTFEAAGKASSSKLIGTWVGDDEKGMQLEMILNKDKTFTIYIMTDDLNYENIDLGFKLTGMWKKQGNNLDLSITKNNFKFIVAPYDQSAYKALPASSKSDLDKMISIMNSSEFKNKFWQNLKFLNKSFELDLLDENFFVIDELWFVKKSSIPTLTGKK